MSNLSIFAKVTIGAITFHSFDDGPSYPGVDRLAKLGSMNRKSVMKAIKELETAGFLKVDRIDGKSNSYEFLSKTSPSQGLPTGQPVPLESVTSPSQGKKTSKPVPPKDSNETKLNETKENEVHPSAIAALPTISKQFTTWFADEYAKRNPSKKYFFQGGKDGMAIKRLVAHYSLDELKGLVLTGWNTPDRKDFSTRAVCMTIAGFSSMVNQLATKAVLSQGKKIEAGGPVDIGWLERSRREREAEGRKAQ